MHALVLPAIMFVGMSYFAIVGTQGLIDILCTWRWRAYVLSPFAIAQCCVTGCAREPRFTIPGEKGHVPITYVCGPHL